MSDEIDEVKRRIDIVDLISSYLTLKKAGANYKALCPFHQEKTPSFMVSSEKQIFKCFGCGRAGDAITFFMEMENLEFPEALKILAERAGVQLPQFKKEEYQEVKDEKTKIYEINRWATAFFHKILTEKPKAQFVKDYLEKRKVTQASITEFKLGYAPDSYNMLSNFLTVKGYSMLDINRAGLRGDRYDRFRDRLMFPIADALGNIIGFSGRAMHETKSGKYINSPDTPIYFKSRVLYGLDKAKRTIKEKNYCLVVEGQMDLISLHQNGYKNAVASSGTALTVPQLEILSRFTEMIVFCFDQDKAGETATKRAINLAHQNGFDVQIIVLPSGKDPDECLRKNPEVWEKALKGRQGAVDYYFEMVFPKKLEELDAPRKREIAKELLSVIKNLSDKVAVSHYIKKLAERLDTPEKFLYEALDKMSASKEKNFPPLAEPNKNIDTVEERLMGLVLAVPKLQPDFLKKMNLIDFQDSTIKELAMGLKKYYNENALFNFDSFKKNLKQYSTKIDFLVLPFENIEDIDSLEKEYNEYINRILAQKTEKVKKFYETKIKEAEKTADKDKLKELINEFQKAIIGK